MGDLISRNELLKEISLQKSYAGEIRKRAYRTWFVVSLSILEDKIAEMQSVDAVRVVRCKDCVFWRKEVSETKHWVCIQHSFDGREMHTMPDFFCGDGRETW